MEQSFAIWMTGLPASGKSTVRARLVEALQARGVDIAVLESDVLRQVLGGGYDDAGREKFYDAMVWIGVFLTRHGVPVVFDATANRRAYREKGRAEIPRFMEVFVDTPLEVCMARDPKGIYHRGLENAGGTVPGLQEEYEAPLSPDVLINGHDADPVDAARTIIEKMVEREFL
jgi:adenylylsulfate kinase